MADGKVKILEFGRGFQSGFTGYNTLYPEKDMSKVMYDAVVKIKPFYCNSMPGVDEANDEKLPAFLTAIQSSETATVKSSKISAYKGIYGGYHLKPTPADILRVDDIPSWHLASEDKHITHRMFEDQLEFRPKCMVLPLRYEHDLAQRIKTALPGNRFVLKAPDQSRGQGVIIVKSDELDEYLQFLLGTQDEVRKVSEQFAKRNMHKFGDQEQLLAHFHKIMDVIEPWRNTNSHVFLVEEYCASKQVVVNNNAYDATMRVAFLVSISDSKGEFTPLGCYWKLPENPVGQGDLRAQTLSHVQVNKQSSHKVSDADQKIVYAELAKCMPAVFIRMSLFSMNQEINTFQARTDKQHQVHAKCLLLHYANTLSSFGKFDEAKALYKQVKKADKNLQYYHEKGIFNTKRGNYNKAIEKFNLAAKLNPQNSPTFFRRAQTYIKLNKFELARADLIKAQQLGFAKERIFVELSKIKAKP